MVRGDENTGSVVTNFQGGRDINNPTHRQEIADFWGVLGCELPR
ncbi:MAG: hypothetical protein M2R46_01872 [Verrucomicrobia subdivision 3 bacterium]|nr:hypothetical protein [Limisphaerales bacterium]